MALSSPDLIMTLPNVLDKDFGHVIRKGSGSLRTEGTCLHQERQFRISYPSFFLEIFWNVVHPWRTRR